MAFEGINAVKQDIRRRMEGAIDVLHQELSYQNVVIHFQNHPLLFFVNSV